MRKVKLSLLTVVTLLIAGCLLAGVASAQDSPSEIQRQIEAARGETLQPADHGIRTVSDFSSPPKDAMVIATRTGNVSPAGLPLCNYLLVVPNNWPAANGFANLVVTGLQGGLVGPGISSAGPVYNFPQVAIPQTVPASYFYWYFGVVVCADQVNLTYQWINNVNNPVIFQWWRFPWPIFFFTSPIIGPNIQWLFPDHTPQPLTQAGVAFNNGQISSFCTAQFDLLTGNCTGTSVPLNQVSYTLLGGLDLATPALPPWSAIAMGLALAALSIVQIRRMKLSRTV